MYTKWLSMRYKFFWKTKKWLMRLSRKSLRVAWTTLWMVRAAVSLSQKALDRDPLNKELLVIKLICHSSRQFMTNVRWWLLFQSSMDPRELWNKLQRLSVFKMKKILSCISRQSYLKKYWRISMHSNKKKKNFKPTHYTIKTQMLSN